MPDPIYTAANCPNPAYQLNWSYSLFWRLPPTDTSWLPSLQAEVESDGVRILGHELTQSGVSQFLISSRPEISPRTIAQRVKGRLQYHIRSKMPAAFQRNYSLRSIGSANREVIDNYVRNQLEHHPCSDARVTQRLRELQIFHPNTDLSKPTFTSHAMYWFNLHLVIVNDGRFREIHDERLRSLHDMISKVNSSKRHLLSRGAILPDYLHLTMRCAIDESPQEVALSYLNNLAYSQGMVPVFHFGYFVGTFGEYDLGVMHSKSS